MWLLIAINVAIKFIPDINFSYKKKGYKNIRKYYTLPFDNIFIKSLLSIFLPQIV